MKIGILLWELDIPGGTQRQALHLAQELLRLGDRVTVYCTKGIESPGYPDLARGLEIRSLSGGGKFPSGPIRLPRVVARWAGRDGEAAFSRALAREIPDDLDILNAHDYSVPPIAYHWKLRTGKPVAYMLNDIPEKARFTLREKGFWKFTGGIAGGKAMEGWRQRRYIRSFDAVVVLDHMNREALERLAGVEARVVRSGLDLDAFPFAPRNPPSADRPVRILSNAIFFPWRRLEDIVAALVILRERGIPFRWTHAGPESRDPGYAKRISEAVKREDLSPHVEFLGEVPEDRLRSLFQEADVFVFPNAPQTWGLAVFQALACGTPAIVSKGSGASEVLADGENALLVDPFRPGQIADAIGGLVSDPDLWRRLHAQGRVYVEKKIRWDLYAGGMRDLFDTVRRWTKA